MCTNCVQRISQILNAFEYGEGNEKGGLEASFNVVAKGCQGETSYVIDVRPFRMLGKQDFRRIRKALRSEVFGGKASLIATEVEYARWWQRYNKEPPRAPRMAEAFRAAAMKN